MARRSHLFDRPAHLLERTGAALGHPMQRMARHPRMRGGLIALLLAAIGLYWMEPEIRRYLRIKRM